MENKSKTDITVNSESENISILVKQYINFTQSNEEIMKTILSSKYENKWINNFHIIDHIWINKWKEIISYDNIIKENLGKDYEKIYKYMEQNIKNKSIDQLNNKNIYYKMKKDKNIIDPMKLFYLITNDAWVSFDIKNNNINYDGKVSILKGKRKIIIKYDENNYGVKYLVSKNKTCEFIITFNPPENEYKDIVIEDLSKTDIFEWMENVKFKYNNQQFSIYNYEIPFDIKQKTNNYYRTNVSSFELSEDDINETSKSISFSELNFSNSAISIYNNSSSFLTSDEYTLFLNNINNMRYVQKYKETSNICTIMRNLSFIDPISEYFMSIIKNYKIFSKFDNLSLLKSIKDYFLNLWSFDGTPFEPQEFINLVNKEGKININEEQDPFIFLKFIISYINNNLKGVDDKLNFDLDEIIEKFKNEELEKIIKNNNSIIGKNFLGLMLEIFKCDKCKDCIFEKIKEFKFIDIDYLPIIKDLDPNDDSNIIGLKIKDFLEYYFYRKNYIGIWECNKCHKKGKIEHDSSSLYILCPKCKTKSPLNYFCPKCCEKNEVLNNNSSIYIHCKKCKEKTDINFQNCPKCGKKSKIIKREIIKFPSYLIIRLNRGIFMGKKGFIYDYEPTPINHGKIKDISTYASDKIKKKDLRYNLISKIDYENNNDSIQFKSMCKSPFQNKWISFYFNSPPKLNDSIIKESSKPYILFYELQKNK